MIITVHVPVQSQYGRPSTAVPSTVPDGSTTRYSVFSPIYIGGVFVSAARKTANTRNGFCTLRTRHSQCTTNGFLRSSLASSRQQQEEINSYRRSSRTFQMAIQIKPATIHADYIYWVTIYLLLTSPLAHHVLFSIFLFTPIKSPMFSPSKWTRMISSACLRP